MNHKIVLGLVAFAALMFEGNCASDNHHNSDNNHHNSNNNNNCHNNTNTNNNNDQNKLTITITFDSDSATDFLFGGDLSNENFKKFEKCKGITWVFEPCECSYIPDEIHTLVCNEGKEQCDTNRMLACAGKSYGASDGFHYGLFVTCVLNTRDRPNAGTTCAQKAGLAVDKINTCLTKNLGNQYCDEYFHKIKRRNPKWVPQIMFDNNYNEEVDGQARSAFIKTVCQQLKEKKMECDACK